MPVTPAAVNSVAVNVTGRHTRSLVVDGAVASS
jgi:hypothetical protein